MSNIFKVSNKDTRTTSGTSIVNFKHISHFILLLILLNMNKCWLGLINGRFRQCVFSNIEEYIVLSGGEICWAIYFHIYSPNLRLQKYKVSRQHFKNISQTLKYPILLNLIQIIKIISISCNLVATLIRICGIQWLCSLFLFSTGNTLFRHIWFKVSELLV